MTNNYVKISANILLIKIYFTFKHYFLYNDIVYGGGGGNFHILIPKIKIRYKFENCLHAFIAHVCLLFLNTKRWNSTNKRLRNNFQRNFNTTFNIKKIKYTYILYIKIKVQHYYSKTSQTFVHYDKIQHLDPEILIYVHNIEKC